MVQAKVKQKGIFDTLPSLIQSFFEALRISDLRSRILFTFAILIIFRILAHIPIPGVDRSALDALFASQSYLAFVDIFSGGGLRNLSIASLGVYPYITASIIVQVLTPLVPYFKNISQQGDIGRKKLTQYTYYLTIPIALAQGFSQFSLFSSSAGLNVLSNFGFGSATSVTITILLVSTATTLLLVWLGDLVSEKGIGNGISLIIFAGIITAIPGSATQLWTIAQTQWLQALIIIIISLIVIILAVYFNEAQRRIPVHYGKSSFRGGQLYRQTGASHIPLRVNSAGMIPLIFAFAVITLPTVFASLLQSSSTSGVRDAGNWIVTNIGPSSWFYWLAIFLLVLFFTFLYTFVVYTQQNIAENLQRNGGFIPGIRPGQPTKTYIFNIIFRITWLAAVFLSCIAIVPAIGELITNIDIVQLSGITILQGTSLLIMVGVAMDTLRQLETQLLMRNYEGFL